PGAEELVALRAGIEGRYDAAVAAQQAAQAAVDALSVQHPLRATAELFASCVALGVTEASSSVAIALGEFQFEPTDAQLEQAINDNALVVVYSSDLTEAEARQYVEESMGATVELRKAFLANQVTSEMALERQGTKDGALLAAEMEVALIEQGVTMLQDFLNR